MSTVCDRVNLFVQNFWHYCGFPFSANSGLQTLTTIWCFGSRQSKLRTWPNCFQDFFEPYSDVCTNLSWLVSFHSGDYRSFDWREQKHRIVLLFCASEFAENRKSQQLKHTLAEVCLLVRNCCTLSFFQGSNSYLTTLVKTGLYSRKHLTQ